MRTSPTWSRLSAKWLLPMQLDAPLVTERLQLRSLADQDVSDEYLGWMNDPLVNRFLESRLTEQTLSSIGEFVRSNNASADTLLLGIFLAGKQHIGNIKLGPVSSHHQSAAIGIMIGRRDAWGKGYAAEAIVLLSRYAFERAGLMKLYAGCYAANTASFRAFQKAGFVLEGRFRSHVSSDGRRDDTLQVGLTRADWRAPQQ